MCRVPFVCRLLELAISRAFFVPLISASNPYPHPHMCLAHENLVVNLRRLTYAISDCASDNSGEAPR